MRYLALLENLGQLIEKILVEKERVLISVVGKNGVGKSHFGRYVRKNGLGKYDKKYISIIDDRILTVKYFGFFKKKVKVANDGIDELEPLLSKLSKRKRIILYINNSPHNKITKADILLKLSTDEEVRRQRLRDRYGSDSEKFRKYFYESEGENYNIAYLHIVEAEV